ncbi:hypothetical protein [Nocardia pseudovaccinii]|uniref:hypothetical protein n=1 Tax=Nocardia pseudovaccinii TaxID=189540 RepID=UPI0007A4A1F8
MLRAAINHVRRAFDTAARATDVGFCIRYLGQLNTALLNHREELRELIIAEVGATRMPTV